jgi:predicted glycosyltransferase
MLTDDALSPQVIGAAVDEALQRPPVNAALDLEGASHAAQILMRELASHRV